MAKFAEDPTPNKIVQEDGSTLLKLVNPVKYKDSVISEITLNRPKGINLHGLCLQDLTEYDVIKEIYESCSDIESGDVIDELNLVDVMACVNVISELDPDDDGKTNTTLLDDGKVKLKLLSPISYGELKISEITIKQPKGKHLRGLDLQDLNQYNVISKIIVSNSELESTKAMDLFDVVDVLACVKVITDFL